ncbi:unnamed protein product, partial [Rotaria sordida]
MVTVGDFNNDDLLDVAVANFGSHTIGIFLSNGNGSFQDQIITSTGRSCPIWIYIADFDNDTLSDIVTTNYGTDSISIWFGYGNASFSMPIMYFIGYDSYPRSVIAGDLNNDNRLDLIIANSGTNNIAILFGNDLGNFTHQNLLSTGVNSHPYSVTLAYLNYDKFVDIVVANYGTRSVGIFLAYGNGSFAPQATYSLGNSSPYSIATGDLNNDDAIDIVVSNIGTNNIGTLRNYKNGTFASPRLYPMGSSSSISVAIGDFNNDNRLDISVVNNDSHSISIFLGYSKGFSGQNMYSTGRSPLFIAVGDFNNDKQLDFVVTNNDDNTVSVFLGYVN